MRRLLLATGIFVVAAAAVIVAWFAIDEATTTDEVAPNVTYDGVALQRAALDRVPEIVDQRAEQILDAPVTIRTPGGAIVTNAGELGLEADRDATTAAITDAGRTGSFGRRLWSWLRAPWEPRTVATVWSWPPEQLATRVAGLDGIVVVPLAEPQVEVRAEAIEVIPGVDGVSVDAEPTAEVIAASFEPGEPLEIDAVLLTSPPESSDETAQALADRLEEITGGGLTVRVLGAVGRLSEATVRDAMEVGGSLTDPQISFVTDVLQEALLELFSTLSRPGSDPVFDVVDGVPEVVEPGTPPRGCCAPDAGQVIIDALMAERDGPVDLPAAAVGDPTLEAWAKGEGVVEVVGEFTTEHACCEARVANIHRIADLIRGQYLLPGESFSVNGFVGERTVEKGFVGAGVIEQGRFTQDVGGGISQFATTFFNAAFFSGLDIDEYQSHSIYISRYPYGREATLSFPKPDLVVTNATEFPVLIWPTYTDTSITVTIYSTEHLVVEETGQEEGPARRCTQVETFRSRTYPDGSVVEDSFLALYRPAEGFDCNGNPTPEP